MEDVACRSPEDTIFTIGHSTRTLTEFMSLLEEVQVNLVLDVRLIPRSSTNPQFNLDVLPEALAAAGIGYRHLLTLGGRRPRSKSAMPSSNRLWRNSSFQNYADYAATNAFRDGLKELTALARHKRCVIMCAEAVWWRCHRRIIADYLLSKGVPKGQATGQLSRRQVAANGHRRGSPTHFLTLGWRPSLLSTGHLRKRATPDPRSQHSCNSRRRL